MLNILFVINPISGGKSKVNWESQIKEYFLNTEHSINFFILDGKDDEMSVKYWLEKKKPDRVVAVGGDGTVSLVAKQLLRTGIPMGIIAAGSANGMAKELDLPTGIKESLDLIVNGEIKASDVIKLNDTEITLHLSDLGMNAQLVKYYDNDKLRGWLGYAKMLLRVLINRKLMKFTITADNEVIKGNAVMIVIANASKYGTGALINPSGNLHDGIFEIVVVRKLSIPTILQMFFQYKRHDPKKVEIIEARNATIETIKPIYFQVDGEYINKVRKVTAQIMKGVILLILSPKKNS
ncbi:MAG: diacylglycerol kinase family lipid kinase [Ginsengibacter sp.]